MEILITIISFVLLIGLVISPILVIFRLGKSNLKNTFFIYLIFSLVITFVLMLIFGWWSAVSNQILLSHYGYSFNAMNDIERFRNVTTENLEKVKVLITGYFGIGWSLKAFMGYIFYFPYLLIVYVIAYFYKKNKKAKGVNDKKSNFTIV